MFRALLIVALLASPAVAWNALGHKVICEIAWQELSPEKRQRIVDTIKRHPAFAEDFARDMPSEDIDRWIFQHAGTWPDLARGGPYDRPTWHYINRPVFLNGERPITANLVTDPSRSPTDKYNCIQAAKHSLAIIHDPNAVAVDKALAYCWLFHLVGDMHQPLHAVSLYGDRFPDGDRGGNSIPLARGRNLHSLWDNLLGRDSRMPSVEREIAELRADRELWNVDTGTPEDWVAESRQLAETVVYDPIILRAASEPGERLQPILLPESYMTRAGRVARQRIVAAGLRLAGLLDQK